MKPNAKRAKSVQSTVQSSIRDSADCRASSRATSLTEEPRGQWVARSGPRRELRQRRRTRSDADWRARSPQRTGPLCPVSTCYSARSRAPPRRLLPHSKVRSGNGNNANVNRAQTGFIYVYCTCSIGPFFDSFYFYRGWSSLLTSYVLNRPVQVRCSFRYATLWQRSFAILFHFLEVVGRDNMRWFFSQMDLSPQLIICFNFNNKKTQVQEEVTRNNKRTILV